MTSEEKARKKIDAQLSASGWIVQTKDRINLSASRGVVAEVERRLSVVEELESVVSANLQRATRLRQSILQKAFTGGLA